MSVCKAISADKATMRAGLESLHLFLNRDLSFIFLMLFAGLLSACGVVQSDSIHKIALLAPFEGRYREIGYNALYSVRLAIEDSDSHNIHLLAVDDGGTVQTAIDRIQALNLDPEIEAIIVLGPFASHPDVQQANDKSLIIIGHWGYALADDHALSTTNPQIAEESDSDAQPFSVNDLYMLASAQDTIDEIEQTEIISSGTLPDADFQERYINSALFVPEPNLLATVTYDVSRLIITAIQTNTPVSDMRYSGINGEIHFENGYWEQAPINHFRYQDGEWVPITG